MSEVIHEIVAHYPREKRHSLAIFQDVQRRLGYIPREALEIIAAYLDLKVAVLYGMATFYRALSLTPKGKHRITLCDGTACHIRGSVSLLDALTRHLGIAPGETTPDGLFSVETVNCLGACAIAPVMVVDGTYYPKVTVGRIPEILASCTSPGAVNKLG